MKLLSINNSCYSSVDNKYNKRAKPAIHTISQQRLTNNNSKPIISFFLLIRYSSFFHFLKIFFLYIQ